MKIIMEIDDESIKNYEGDGTEEKICDLIIEALYENTKLIVKVIGVKQ